MPKSTKTYKTTSRRKSLPYDTNAEKAILGASLSSYELCTSMCESLTMDDFYDENRNHQLIFNAIYKLYRENKPIDIQTVNDELINTNNIDIAGGPEYLFELADNFVGYENARHCIGLVYDQAVLRRYLLKIEEINNRYYNTEIDSISSFISTSQKELEEISNRRTIADFKNAQTVTDALQARLAKLKDSPQANNIGVTTGYSYLNKLIHGFQPGQLIILAARPGVGKTAFGLNVCYNAAVKEYPVAYFSLEMTAEELMTRVVATDAQINQEKIKYGTGNEKERLAIKQACDRIARLPLYIDDTAGIRIIDLVAKTRKLKNEVPNLGLVVVDYIGLVRYDGKMSNNDNRQMIIQETSQELKRLALELQIAIICVAQLNRNVEQRGGNPMLSDLRESGSLEQDADVVLLMSGLNQKRTGKSNYGSKDGELTEESRLSVLQTELSKLGPNIQLVNIDVAKNRAGQIGSVYLLFKKDFGSFIEPDAAFIEQIKNYRGGNNQ